MGVARRKQKVWIVLNVEDDYDPHGAEEDDVEKVFSTKKKAEEYVREQLTGMHYVLTGELYRDMIYDYAIVERVVE